MIRQGMVEKLTEQRLCWEVLGLLLKIGWEVPSLPHLRMPAAILYKLLGKERRKEEKGTAYPMIEILENEDVELASRRVLRDY